ncbi:hypothetical protein ACKTEK_01215 [Tepidamorphus sp. 3E244]|uniref:hypothetical protein n=1 Tax=Tepidamorphus sp. 3E244 TaxID=3385498 RepID=UPI0038FCF05A
MAGSNDDGGTGSGKPAKGADANTRETRLANALKANLRRRKAQKRGRADHETADEHGAPDATDPPSPRSS